LIFLATQTFAKKDLPQSHRVVQGDSPMTMDFNPDRWVRAVSRCSDSQW